jgi:hypothetical protein
MKSSLLKFAVVLTGLTLQVAVAQAQTAHCTGVAKVDIYATGKAGYSVVVDGLGFSNCRAQKNGTLVIECSENTVGGGPIEVQLVAQLQDDQISTVSLTQQSEGATTSTPANSPLICK